MTYVPRLDSLRFLAAFAIITFHWFVCPWGWIGVQFFFVLSGFLITGILIRERAQFQGLREFLGIFFMRRALRIMPLYFAYVLILTLVYLTFREPPSFPRAAPFLYTFTVNIDKVLPGYNYSGFSSHLWSLGIEWQFYLLWPFVIWFVPEKGLLPTLLALIGLAPILRAISGAWMIHTGASPEMTAQFCYYMTWSYLDAFAFGAILNWQGVTHFLRRPEIVFLSVALCAVGGAYVVWASRGTGDAPLKTLGYPNYMTHHHQYIWGYSLLSFVSACIIALSLGESVLNKLTDLKLLQHFGKISYGIYVYHRVVLGLGFRLFPALQGHVASPVLWALRLFLLLPLTMVAILCAHVSYFYFEKLCLKKRDKLERQIAANHGP